MEVLNIIIIEGDTKPKAAWMELMQIGQDQWVELIEKGIFSVNKDDFRNNFVGSFKLEQGVYYSMPKCFGREYISTSNVSNLIELVNKVLLRFSKRKKENKTIKEYKNYFHSTRFLGKKSEYELYLSLKALYLRTGLLSNEIVEYRRTNTHGGVNWPRTIKTTNPIVTNDSPLYNQVIVSKDVQKDYPITSLQKSILKHLTGKYRWFDSDVEISNRINSEEVSEVQIDQIRADQIFWLSQIDRALSVSFNDDIKDTLSLLRDSFFLKGEVSGAYSLFYGTCYFHHVWEDATSVITGNQKEKHIDSVAQPNYTLSSGKPPGVHQDPDILIAKSGAFYILDAKYYVGNKSFPGWKDIVKQLFYEKSFVDTSKYSELRNCFLMPSFISENYDQNFRSKYFDHLGKVEVNNNNGKRLPDFPIIQIIGLDPLKVFKLYLEDKEFNQFFKYLDQKVFSV